MRGDGKITPPIPMQQRCYEQYLEPYLDPEIDSGMHAYFLEQAFGAWWNCDIKKDDLKNLEMVIRICHHLYSSEKEEFIEMASYLQEEGYEMTERSEQSRRSERKASDSEDTHEAAHAQLSLYKTQFENEFRLWATIPFLYAVKGHGVKSKAKSLRDAVNVSASTKFHGLREVNVSSLGGLLSDLTFGFDNKIRNSGAGHDHWEITDDNLIILRDIHPETGKERDKIVHTIESLKSLSRECNKSLWLMRNGFYIFMHNTPEFYSSLSRKKEWKIKEIKFYISQIAEERLFKIKELDINQAKTDVSVVLQRFESSIGEPGEMLLSNGERYDILKLSDKANYSEQIFGILQHLVSMLDRRKVQELSVTVLNIDGKKLTEYSYDSAAIQKIPSWREHPSKLSPASGRLPYGNYEVHYELKVPYGAKGMFAGLKTINDLKQFNETLKSM